MSPGGWGERHLPKSPNINKELNYRLLTASLKTSGEPLNAGMKYTARLSPRLTGQLDETDLHSFLTGKTVEDAKG